MSRIYLPEDASRARIRDAENARKNRAEIVKAQSQGQVSRRDLLKLGLFTGAGLLAPIGGLNPFVGNSGAQIPTGAPRSPLFGAREFSQPMYRFDLLTPMRNTLGVAPLNPLPRPDGWANTDPRDVDPLLGGGQGPKEGRPPGGEWAHQRWGDFPPQAYYQVTQQGARANTSYNPGVVSKLNNGILPSKSIAVRYHPKMPIQDVNSVWTFNGTVPPKLVQARYGEPILLRHYNGLPADVTANNGFGRHTISTHEHNGHHGAENDGFTGAYFFPGQFYDYHWPVVYAGHDTINLDASDARAAMPLDGGGRLQLQGDWHETMSTHWFHDHMFSFTSQNVYKGNAAMMNIYSAVDRGSEVPDFDAQGNPVNLCLPSGTSKSWGNLDYDVNLLVQDQAYDANGQLFFDIFDFDGFLGDVMTVNFAYKPYFEVEARKYRFRILNACTSRFLKIALCDKSGNAVPMTQIANDGNLLPNSVALSDGVLDAQGTAERYDIVIDFKRFLGQKLYLVNVCEHVDGKGPSAELSVAQALSGQSLDPAVGRFLEFRVVRSPAKPDQSQVPGQLIPNPDLSTIGVQQTRNFIFGRDGVEFDASDSIAQYIGTGTWGIGGGDTSPQYKANFNMVSAAPKYGTREVWNLVNKAGGWSHPIHIHFEEGIILSRQRNGVNVPLNPWERGRKDVYRLGPNETLSVSLQFRDWGGMFMEHCHNTVHEDNAMLLRWELSGDGSPYLAPLPTPYPSPQGVVLKPNPIVL